MKKARNRQHFGVKGEKKKKNLPLPFGVMTCTRSSTVTLFLPFFLVYALVESNQKTNTIESLYEQIKKLFLQNDNKALEANIKDVTYIIHMVT